MVRKIMLAIVGMLFLVGCCGIEVDSGGPPLPAPASIPLSKRYRLMVGKFKLSNRVLGYHYSGVSNLEENLPEEMENALMSTNHFRMVNRSEMKALLNEQDFGTSDRVDPNTSAKIGKVSGAEIYIKPTILDLRIGRGGAIGGGASTFGLGIGMKTSEVEIMVRAINITTSEVLFSKRVTARANSCGVVAASVFSVNHRNYWAAGGGFYETSIGKAVQAALVQAARHLARAIGSK